MSELQKRPEETPEVWLSRLERIDPTGLSLNAQRTLALSLGYARFLAHKARGTSEAADRPQPEWVIVGAG
jgi:hypothetical protein